MTAGVARYGPCPSCRALNMAHREHCYRCRKPLPPSFWQPEDAAPAPQRPSGRPSGQTLRRHRRVDIYISGAQVEGEGIRKHNVTIKNISLGGLLFRSPCFCHIGANLRISMPLEGRVWTLDGIVRHICPLTEDDIRMYACGAEFLQLSPLLQRLIQNLT